VRSGAGEAARSEHGKASREISGSEVKKARKNRGEAFKYIGLCCPFLGNGGSVVKGINFLICQFIALRRRTANNKNG
jgi:hypothetical protein